MFCFQIHCPLLFYFVYIYAFGCFILSTLLGIIASMFCSIFSFQIHCRLPLGMQASKCTIFFFYSCCFLSRFSCSPQKCPLFGYARITSPPTSLDILIIIAHLPLTCRCSSRATCTKSSRMLPCSVDVFQAAPPSAPPSCSPKQGLIMIDSS